MPQILTKYFGAVEYRDEDVVRFPSGLPAFDDELEFLVFEPRAKAPLAFLQSMRQPGLCFVTLPVLAIDASYALAITRDDLEALELDTSRQPGIGVEVDCLAVIVVNESSPASANLLAPVVINRHKRLGAQAVRVDNMYSHQHRLTPAEDICS